MSPKPEDELTLLCAGTAASRRATRERSQQLLRSIDWTRLADRLRAQRLLATIGPRMLALAGERANPDFSTSVRDAIASGRRQDALLQLTSERIVAALSDGGIRSTVLKGPQLGEAIYGEPGRRPSRDIDLLVAADQLAAAVQIVRGLGYQAPKDHTGSCGLPLLHFALAHERGQLPPVELHWRIHWYERDFARQRLLAPGPGEPNGWRPPATDQLAALLLFYARDGFIGLRLAADLAAWWDTFGEQTSPDALDSLLVDYPALTRPILAAAIAAEQLVGLPAVAIDRRSRAPRLRERVAVKIAEPAPRASLAQLYAEVGLVDWLLAPTAGFRGALRRQLLPPRDVRVQRARDAGANRSVSSVGHSLRVVSRYGLTITRLLFARR
jgi:Uncharacterised nucleotidyltransferase